MKKEKKKKKDRKQLANSELTPIEMSEFPTSFSPLRFLTETIGGKWKISILWALREQKGRRYGEIKSEIEGITDMMLSQSLRELVESNLVSRQQFQEIPPRVEYCITPIGAELLPTLSRLIQWALVHGKKS